MKNLFLVIAVALFSLPSTAQFKSANLQAAGLTCAMCTKAVNKSLEKVSFVKDVKPDIRTSSFNITFKDGADVDFDIIEKAVEDAGFSVAKLKVNGTFDHVAVHNDTHVKIGNKTFHFLNVSDQVLNGDKSLMLVDKSFVSAKDFKKYSAATSMSCIHTGKAGACCTRENVQENTRIYHVTI